MKAWFHSSRGKPTRNQEALAEFFITSFEGGKQKWQYDTLVVIYFHHGELDQLSRHILMNSASKAFGEGAGNLGISSEPVTARQVLVAIATCLNEQVFSTT